jgi:hypothetical protein
MGGHTGRRKLKKGAWMVEGANVCMPRNTSFPPLSFPPEVGYDKVTPNTGETKQGGTTTNLADKAGSRREVDNGDGMDE